MAVVIPSGYDVNDITHRQISVEAYNIVIRNGGHIPPGRRDDKSPNFRGLSEAWWQRLYNENNADYSKLMAIMRRDFPTFCALLARIVSRLDSQRTPFIWNNGQRAVWNKMMWCVQMLRMIFIVVLKARQMGITTLGTCWHFWQMWRSRDVSTLDTTHNDKLAKRIVKFYSVFYESLPTIRRADGSIDRLMKPELRQKAEKARVPKSEMEFVDRNCKAGTFVAKNIDDRGDTAQHIGFREPAFYGPSVLNDLYQTVEPQLPALGTKARLACSIMIESTPNGQNDFYDFWEASKQPDSEYVGIFLPWFIHDDEYTLDPPEDWRMSSEDKDLQLELSVARRKIDGQDVTREQMYWRHIKIVNLKGDTDAFDMEYPSDDVTCFLMKSESVFTDDMKYMMSSVAQAEMRAKDEWSKLTDTKGNPIETTGAITGTLRFETLPSPFAIVRHRRIQRPRFVIGSGDLWVWEPPKRGHIYFSGADVAGGEFGRDSSTCFVMDLVTGRQVAEFRGWLRPESFGDQLVHLCAWYNNMMIMPEVNSLGQTVIHRMSDWGFSNFAHEEKPDELGVKKNKPGWWTSTRNRPMIFSTLKFFISERYLMPASRAFVAEASTFKKDGMEYRTAKSHQHDDLVVSAGLCCIGIKQAPKYMAMVDSARGVRVPTAVELGLSHQTDLVSIENAKIRDSVGDEVFDNMFGLGSYEFPANPLRGHFDVEW